MSLDRVTWSFKTHSSWWRHQMEPFSALLALCEGNSPVTVEFPSQRPVTWSFDVFFDLRLNTRLSKQSWGWWFEMPSYSLWCLCNGYKMFVLQSSISPTLSLSFLHIEAWKNLIEAVAIIQDWLGKCLSTEQATSHYLNRWRNSVLAHMYMRHSATMS